MYAKLGGITNRPDDGYFQGWHVAPTKSIGHARAGGETRLTVRASAATIKR